MQPTTKLMRIVMGLGFSTFVLIGCQDMLGNSQRETAKVEPTGQDLQVIAQQGISEDANTTEQTKTAESTDTAKCDKVVAEEPKSKEVPQNASDLPSTIDSLAVCKELEFQLNSEAARKDDALYMAVKQKFTALNCFQVIGNATPAIPPKEPTQEENCLTLKNLIATAGTDNPKYPVYVDMYKAQCAEAKPQETPVAPEPVKPEDATKTPIQNAPTLDTTAVCLDLHAKLNQKEVFDNVDLYMQIKNRFGELNCFAFIGNPQPTTPPKEPTQEEVCANLKSSMEMMGTDSPKYPYYLADYQKLCVEVK